MLKHNKVLNFVIGEEKVLENPGAEASDEEIASYEQNLKEFDDKNSLAQLILTGSLNDVNEKLTSTCASAKDIWNKLVSVYEQSSGQKIDRLIEKFFTAEKDPAENIATHISGMQRIFCEQNFINITCRIF